MKKTIMLIGNGLENSSQTTQEFLTAYRAFKGEFTKILRDKECTDIEIGKGHFYISGFFRAKTGQLWYFNLSDLRDPADRMNLLYRTAMHNKDYTGGGNRWCQLSRVENDMKIDHKELQTV